MMEKNIFKFSENGKDSYIGTCENLSIGVRRSGRGWSWKLSIASPDGVPFTSRSGYVRAGTPRDAWASALTDAADLLDEILETGTEDGEMIADGEASALEAAFAILDDCRYDAAG